MSNAISNRTRSQSDAQLTSDNLLRIFNGPEETDIVEIRAFDRKLLGLSTSSDDQVVVLDGSSVVRGDGLGIRIDGSNALRRVSRSTPVEGNSRVGRTVFVCKSTLKSFFISSIFRQTSLSASVIKALLSLVLRKMGFSDRLCTMDDTPYRSKGGTVSLLIMTIFPLNPCSLKLSIVW